MPGDVPITLKHRRYMATQSRMQQQRASEPQRGPASPAAPLGPWDQEEALLAGWAADATHCFGLRCYTARTPCCIFCAQGYY